MVTFHMARVVVVALVERHVPLACAVVKGAVGEHAALAAAQNDPVPPLLGAPEGNEVAHVGALVGGGG